MVRDVRRRTTRREAIGGSSMRRLARTALAAGFALFMPWSSAWAAPAGDPGGSTLNTITEVRCVADTCTTVYFNVLRYDDRGNGICLDIYYTDEAGVVFEQESGCSFSGVGSITTSATWITGIGATQLTVTNLAGASRTVNISGAHSIVSTVRHTSAGATWEEDGCLFVHSYKERLVDATGTVTMDGVSYASDGVSTYFQPKTKVRC
jgi:hypothetical protein